MKPRMKPKEPPHMEPRVDELRDLIVRHVKTVQREVRSCAGCGACCAEPFNTVRILPLEAQRIAGYVRRLARRHREDLIARVELAVRRYGFTAGTRKKVYTCPFLDHDRSCVLPYHIKPVACLAYNPVTGDRCDMETDWFWCVYDAMEPANRSAGLPMRRAAIPWAVLQALRGAHHAQ